MIDGFKWMLRKEEIEFEQIKFKGELAGKAYEYSKNIDGLIRTRIIIFVMSVLVLYRVLANYLFYQSFDFLFLIERLVFSVVILVGGLMFNKFRTLGIVLAVIPLLVILSTYLFVPSQNYFRIIAFMFATISVILIGIYHNAQLQKIKKELEKSNIENQLID